MMGRLTARTGLLLMAGLGLSLAACASVDRSEGFGPALASAPTPVPDYDWFFHGDEQQASLAYGLKESDDLRLGLECTRGAGRLALSAVAPSGTREIRLESGGDMDSFRAEGEPSELHAGDFLTAQAKADLPIFQRFRRLGWMAQWRGEHREAYAAHPATLPDIDRFFAFCG